MGGGGRGFWGLGLGVFKGATGGTLFLGRFPAEGETTENGPGVFGFRFAPLLLAC